MKLRCLLFLLCAATAAAQQPTTVPRPLDPLTSAERDRAVAVARNDARVRELLGGGGRVIYVQMAAPKRPDANGKVAAEPSGRHAEVLFHIDPDKGGVKVLVDLERGDVVATASIPEAAVPITISDVELAARIALVDPAVQRLFGERLASFRVQTGRLTRENANDNLIQGLRTLGTSATDPCTTHRCIVLLFRSGREYLFNDRQITVDLSARTVTMRGGER